MTMTAACVLMGGSVYDIEVSGTVYHFEMHPYCGPTIVSKKGAVAAVQPGEQSPFWDAVSVWDKQGRRVDERGRCIWERPEPTETRLRHLRGKHYKCVADDDPTATHIEIKDWRGRSTVVSIAASKPEAGARNGDPNQSQPCVPSSLP